jgi:hypothetical protein
MPEDGIFGEGRHTAVIFHDVPSGENCAHAGFAEMAS